MNKIEYIVAVFYTRSNTYAFYDLLRKNGINSSIIDTPKTNIVSCGISVKFAYKDIISVRKLSARASGFVGFFKVTIKNGFSTIVRL